MLPAPSLSSVSDDGQQVISRRVFELQLNLSVGLEVFLSFCGAEPTPPAVFCRPSAPPAQYVFMHGHGGAGRVEAVSYDVLLRQHVSKRTYRGGGVCGDATGYVGAAGGGEEDRNETDVSRFGDIHSKCCVSTDIHQWVD